MAPEQIDSMTQRLVISPSKANKIDVRYEDIEKDKINNRLRESRELKRIEIATNKEAKSAPAETNIELAETNIQPSQAKIDMAQAQVNIAKVPFPQFLENKNKVDTKPLKIFLCGSNTFFECHSQAY